MKDQNRTRFEVGMPVIYLNGGYAIEAKVTSLENKTASEFAKRHLIVVGWNQGVSYLNSTFTNDGFATEDQTLPSLFTLSEYEALKALTDSFIGGTFGKEQPILQDNPIVSTKPFETTEWGKKNEPAEKPTPISGEWKETADLLDENGQPVYFEVGQDVGSLVYGKGKVIDKDDEKGNLFINFPDEGEYWHTFDGRECTGGNQTLYPIEQYNAIQLPKLKPIQVAKPKEDVIELPSWFKGGAIIHSQCVSDYFWDNYNDKSNILESFGKIITKVGAEGAPQLTFYSCKSVNDGVKIEFTFNSKFYGAIILYEVEANEEISVTAMYDKNGKHITEIL